MTGIYRRWTKERAKVISDERPPAKTAVRKYKKTIADYLT